MEIKILNRSNAINLSYKDFEGDKIIISIRDPFNEQAQFNEGNSSIKEILYLSFYDISSETKDIFDGYTSMSPDDALKISKFIKKWKDKVDYIWVQCEAGVSRSAGIAMAIMKYLNMDLSSVKDSNLYSPNMLCYNLTKTAFENLDEKDENL
jgi:predicted protein tyrosine phosphatase